VEDIYMSSSCSSTEGHKEFCCAQGKWDKFRRAKRHVFFTCQVTINQHRLLWHVEVSLLFDVLKSALDIFVQNMPQACPSSDCFGLFHQAMSELQLEVHNGSPWS